MLKLLWAKLNIKINKILSLLAIMIFVLGLSCASARVLTKEEVANFMLNGYQLYSGQVTDTLINNVNNRMAKWQSIADLTNTYQGNYTIIYNPFNKYFTFIYYTGSSSDLGKAGLTSINWYYASDRYYIGKNPYTSGGLSYHIYNYNIVNDTLTETTYTNGNNYNDVGNTVLGQTNKWFFYTDRALPANSNSQSSLSVGAGGQRPTSQDLFAENFISSLKFEFEPTTNYRSTISGDTSGYQYYVIDKTFAKTLFGTFVDSKYLEYIYYNIRAYQSGEGWQDILVKTYDCANNKVSNYFYTYSENDLQYTDLRFDSNSIPSNSAVTLIFSPNTIDFDEVAITFFIKNDNTIINNGVIDIQATIRNNSNYNNEVNQAIENAQNNDNANNIQDIVNDLTNDSEVGNIINSELSQFNSGDLGYVEYENPFGEFVFGFFEGACNTLLDSGDVVIDISHHGQNWQLRSGDFRLPSNTLTTFVRTLMTFVVVYCIYKFFYFIIHALQTADFSKLKNNIVDQDMKDINLL